MEEAEEAWDAQVGRGSTQAPDKGTRAEVEEAYRVDTAVVPEVVGSCRG